MMKKAYDIIIVGGGLTGATLLLALEHSDYDILLLEATPLSHKIKADFDARTLALSPSSQRIFKNLNLWQDIEDEAIAIESIEASRQFHFGRSHIKAETLGPLGHVIEMQVL